MLGTMLYGPRDWPKILHPTDAIIRLCGSVGRATSALERTYGLTQEPVWGRDIDGVRCTIPGDANAPQRTEKRA
jgi:hypothetical protein